MLPAGERASKPAELLASCDFAGLLNEAALHFDRIVLDSAPVNAVSDTQLIAKDTQSVCFVVRAVKPRDAPLSGRALCWHKRAATPMELSLTDSRGVLAIATTFRNTPVNTSTPARMSASF